MYDRIGRWLLGILYWLENIGRLAMTDFDYGDKVRIVDFDAEWNGKTGKVKGYDAAYVDVALDETFTDSGGYEYTHFLAETGELEKVDDGEV